MPVLKIKKAAEKKICSNAGDSIAEVLIALLIAALALVMLASMITASANMITRSKTYMNTYYTNCNTLNSGPGDFEGNLTLTLSATNAGNNSVGIATQQYSASYNKVSYQNKDIVSFWKGALNDD